mmetsp:Transcript_3497/g.7076  ORF Transcript_3497/g.7076 Transcript_3497/m.7076 type:complete len:217 (-) Transcript_3497:32-682(-)
MSRSLVWFWEAALNVNRRDSPRARRVRRPGVRLYRRDILNQPVIIAQVPSIIGVSIIRRHVANILHGDRHWAGAQQPHVKRRRVGWCGFGTRQRRGEILNSQLHRRGKRPRHRATMLRRSSLLPRFPGGGSRDDGATERESVQDAHLVEAWGGATAGSRRQRAVLASLQARGDCSPEKPAASSRRATDSLAKNPSLTLNGAGCWVHESAGFPALRI